MNFTDTVSRTLHTHGLLRAGCRCVVALSGGADSVALLRVLLELGFDVVAAHCNFQLRGDESGRDEKFCRTLCRRLDVELRVVHFDTRAEARARGESIEMAARRLRYDWFETLRRQLGAEAVCVAHHNGDHVETLLLNLIRGTGLYGLTGISYRRDHIVRPLLDVGRADILDYLRRCRQDYVNDSSNTDTVFKRNAVRHELLPLMRRLNPAVDEALTACARRLQVVREAYDAVARQVTALGHDLPHGHAYPLEALRYGAHYDEIARRYGFREADMDALRTGRLRREGALIESATHVAVVARECLEVYRRAPEMPPCELRPGVVQTLPGGLEAEMREVACADLPEVPRGTTLAAFDADAVCGPVVCRAVRAGDRFAPLGMRGTKLVNDFLAGRRVSRAGRPWCRVVADARGILWVVGHRIDRRAALTPATRRVLLVRCEEIPAATEEVPAAPEPLSAGQEKIPAAQEPLLPPAAPIIPPTAPTDL